MEQIEYGLRQKAHKEKCYLPKNVLRPIQFKDTRIRTVIKGINWVNEAAIAIVEEIRVWWRNDQRINQWRWLSPQRNSKN